MQNEPTLKNAQAIANQSQMPKFQNMLWKNEPNFVLK
jgi:hypothetical protein